MDAQSGSVPVLTIGTKSHLNFMVWKNRSYGSI
jgi:hypothetical protein